VPRQLPRRPLAPTDNPEPPIARLLFADTRVAWFWLLVRISCGWQWLEAGFEKTRNPAWFGSSAGGALRGFINGTLQKTAGDHPDVTGWYAGLLQSFVLPNATLWSNLVTLDELLVGVSLVVGALTGIAAFFGSLMYTNYLLAGTVSSNPCYSSWGPGWCWPDGWRAGGGLDRWLLPLLGTPWWRGRLRHGRPDARGSQRTRGYSPSRLSHARARNEGGGRCAAA
jgi:thiosulfate dehydrogenase (quinone) large subunit